MARIPVKACQDLKVERSGGLYNSGPFTPFFYHAPGAAPKSGNFYLPPGNGGANWGGTAAILNTGYVFADSRPRDRRLDRE